MELEAKPTAPAKDAEGEATPTMSVEEALELFEFNKSYWEETYREIRRDFEILSNGCWTSDELNQRTLAGKPSLHIDQLSQYVNQVVNDIRQNTPSIQVIPDTDGDVETAEIFSDYCRAIEYKSAADTAYDTAALYQVSGGLGFIAVAHDYIGDDGDEQELLIKSVPDPLSVFLDPSSVELDGRDANNVVVLEPITKKEFERLYPKEAYVSFTEAQNKEQKSETITLGKIYVREMAGKRGKKAVIRAYLFSGEKCLAASVFHGSYIPYVPVYGKVMWVNGKRIVSGLIRNARDAQRRVDYWASKEMEYLNMGIIAPVMAVEGTLVNDRNQWQKQGSETVLEYKQVDSEDRPAPAPTRLSPPQVPAGIINALEGAKQNVREAIGMYQASLGERSNETSGVAIRNRQREGDVATYHFPDGVRRSVQQCGTIIVCAIPEIIDTPRILQTINNEMSPKMVAVNGADPVKGQKRPYDLREGKYHVRVSTGASYTTKRQQESETLGEIIKANPQMLSVIGDLWARNSDFPGAQALADRFKKTLPLELKDPEEGQAPPDPEKQQMAQMIQELQGQLQQIAPQMQAMESELKNKQGELQVKAHDTEVTSRMEEMKLQQAAKQSEMEHEAKMGQLRLQERELALREYEIQLKYAPKNDAQKAVLEHQLNEEAADNQLQRDLIMQSQQPQNSNAERMPDDTANY